MLNFRNTNIFFVLLLCALIVLQYNRGFDMSWFIAVILWYAVVVFYGSFYIRSNFFIKTFSSSHTHEKIIALSFDDGPSHEFTPEVLDILKRENVPATFFLIGEHVDGQKELVRRIIAEGHLIGNHTFYHSHWFDLQSATKMQAEMQQTHSLVHQYTGRQMNWFRPPYGVTNPNVKKAIVAMGYHSIGWNIRSLDTMIKNPERLLARLRQMLQPGSVILLHDTQWVTVQVLPVLIQYVKAQGYSIISLDKLLHLQPYKTKAQY